MTSASIQNTAVVPGTQPPARDVDTVPFVELCDNRLQGVVSSGSDPARVYCAFLEASSGDYYSSTNNNRPDAGMAKRLNWLAEEAIKQFGVERVVRYLQVSVDPAQVKRPADIVSLLTRRGQRRQEPAGTVFTRFLNYLRFVELPPAAGPMPEMSWFVAR
jgi:hypothetical protein